MIENRTQKCLSGFYSRSLRGRVCQLDQQLAGHRSSIERGKGTCEGRAGGGVTSLDNAVVK